MDKEQLLQELTKTDWHYWHIRKRPPLLIYFFYYGAATQAWKEFPYYVKTSGQCCGHVITKKAELEAFKDTAWKKFKQEPTFVLKFMERTYAQNKKDRQGWMKLYTRDFSKATNQELLKEYQKYVKQLLAYSPAIYLPLALEPVLTEECKRLLTTEQYTAIMTPVKESEVIEERKSVLRMAIKKKQKKPITADLKKHVERFSFLKQKDMFMEFYDEAHYLEKIGECTEPEKELRGLDEDTKRKQKEFQDVLDAFKDDTFSQLLFRTTNEAIFFRSWRTERYSQSTYYVVPLFAEMAKRLKLDTYQEVVWLLPPELEGLLQKNKQVDKELIKQRKEAFTCVTFGSETILILQGTEAHDSLKRLKIFDTTSSEIRGTPAYTGKVSGKVTLISDRNEWPRIRNAEVLVIHTTTPDMVPYLKNVKAIVTEEGGILSHASVISRELKIPCVIGTKTATKILKEGEMVQVDAEKGIVRKVSR